MFWLAIQIVLCPLRIYKKEDPLMRFKTLWAGVFVEGSEPGEERPETLKHKASAALSDLDTEIGSRSSGSDLA